MRLYLCVVPLVALNISVVAATQPAGVESKFRQGTEALHADRLDEAIAAFKQVTQAAPRFAEAFFNLGLALSQEGKHAEAIAAFEKAVALKPTMRGVNLFLAISQYNLGRFAPASIAIRKETRLSPDDAKAWMWQGIIDLASANLPNAVEALDKAAELDPKNVDILYHRGRASLDLSRQSYEQMFQADPHSWHVHQVLAQADVEAGKDSDAVEQYQKAIAAAPPQSGLYEAMGTALWRLGKFKDAEAALEEALKVDPGDVVAEYKLGCLRVDLSRPEEAKPLLQRVLALDPSLKLTSYYLGRAEIQLGNASSAVGYFKQTIAANIDSEITRQAYFQMSRAYRRLNENAEADAAQAQYRLLDQQSKEAQQELLEKTRLRYDRDTSVPTAPDDKPETQN